MKSKGKTKTTATTAKTDARAITPERIESVRQRLANNLRVRRTLPAGGRLHIDRQLPFLCAYRLPEREDVGTRRLVKGEASYLVGSGAASEHAGLSNLLREVIATLSPEFGAFLIIEIWAGPDGGKANDPAIPTALPKFTIHAPAAPGIAHTIESLQKHLGRIKVLKQGVEVETVRDGRAWPPDLRPLLTPAEAARLRCSVIGIEVPPVYRKPNSTEQFPLLGRSLRRSLSLALRHAFFEFARSCTTHRPRHYHALGRKAVVKAVWTVDKQLADVSNQFDYLLQLTPVNPVGAWRQFSRGGFERVPEFHYRPLPVDPARLKRQLYAIPIERIEDPALQRVFQEKQEELDVKLSMLRDRDTPRFLYESLQLFGGVDDELLSKARRLLAELSEGRKPAGQVDAAAFAQRAQAEFERYRRLAPGFKARAVVTSEVSGLMVSRGKLLINADLSLPEARVDALLAHEVGTHLVTYYNGRMQPFQQLYAGLANYEALQEGLGVLSEYLVGGLSRSRMRQLAARVVAVRQLVDGASFVEAFRSLHRDFGFAKRRAYNVTMRVYRGGGLTKDAVYLRGLDDVLAYVRGGGDLEPLLVGKIGVEHISIVRELQYRNVLKPVPILPRHLQDDRVLDRLKRLRGSSTSVVSLLPVKRARGGSKG